MSVDRQRVLGMPRGGKEGTKAAGHGVKQAEPALLHNSICGKCRYLLRISKTLLGIIKKSGSLREDCVKKVGDSAFILYFCRTKIVSPC